MAAMWRDFGAQLGTYEIDGDTLVLRSEIAKTPAAMRPGAFQKYLVRGDRDAIWLQLVADQSAPLPNQERARLARSE